MDSKLKKTEWNKFLKEYKTIIFLDIIFLIIFIKLADDFLNNRISAFDDAVYQPIATFINISITKIMVMASFFASGIFLTVFSFIIYFILRKSDKYRVYGKFLFANMILSYVLNEFLKSIFQRTRPNILRLTEVTGFSFPSGHAMESLCFYGMILYLLFISTHSKMKRFIIVLSLGLIIFFIGLSRVYLGVHYASDVLAGYCAGFIWITLFIIYIKIKINALEVKD